MASIAVDPAPAPRLAARHIAAVTLGNALEFYDFVTYAFFAAQIGRAFFPNTDPTASLLASLATFGAGFLMRPVGAVVIGRLADRRGRKPAMLLTFTLIGFAVTGLAFTPSYAAIGVAAPVLAVLFRLLQGFALGGELGPSTAFLMEAAPIHRRGLYISFQCFGADCATLFAGLVGVILSAALSPTTFDAWGWRIAFLLGAAIVPFGLWLRRSLPETVDLPEPATARAPGERRVIATGLVLLSAGALAAYVLNYLTTYASTTLAMPVGVALGATAVVGLAGAVVDPLAGWLSDRFGRKPAMLVPWTVMLLATMPAFWLVAHYRTRWALYTAAAVLAAAQSMAVVGVLVAVTEGVPKRVRAGALGLVYALAISVVGGSTQFVIAWATRATGDPLAPAWYLLGGAAIGLVAMLRLPETAPHLGRDYRP